MYTHLFAGARKFLGGTYFLLFLFLAACSHLAISAKTPSADIASSDAPSASMQAVVTQPESPTAKSSIALYHEIWEIAGRQYHNVTDLTNWSQWEHKFDSQINSDADAITFANQMLGSLKSGNFGVIALYNFEQSSVQKEMADALIRFKNANGLVLDLRGNPGGYTETALKAIAMIIKKGTIVTLQTEFPVT